MTLTELFQKHGSDKHDESSPGAGHCYGPLYERLLEGKRERITSVLEIGVLKGASLRAWRDWFPNAWVHGMDKDSECLFWGDRIECSLADQEDPSSLIEMAEAGRCTTFDLVVDDGSHRAQDQLTTLATLFHRLRPGGDWFIEDVGHVPLQDVVTAVGVLIGNRAEVTVHDLRHVRDRHDDLIIQVRVP